MCEAGHVLVITYGFYKASLGSAVVMRNLLHEYSPKSFTVLTTAVSPELSASVPPELGVQTIRTGPPFGMRGERYWRDIFYTFLERRIEAIARRVKPVVIIAVYPMLHFFAASVRAAERCGIPLVAYLHDTLAEQYRGTRYESMAEEVQRSIFSSARSILVTGRGMSDLYRSRYAVESVPLEIGYREPIPDTLPPAPDGAPHAFMGGSIYAVNDRCVLRMMGGAQRAGLGFRLASPADWENLQRLGIMPQDGLEKVHYTIRSEYLEALRQQHVLTVGLNWPDESTVPEDELSTAFPTKAVEYLASGQPILVHCPENYFLARFFRDHECGIVVSVRDADAIAAAAKWLMTSSSEQERMRRNALRAARLFSMELVAARLRQTLDDAVADRIPTGPTQQVIPETGPILR